MNLILCGLPGAGKTTVGQLVAAQLNKEFLDTDRLIESRYASHKGEAGSCRQIFQQEGEAYFRSLERDVVASLVVYKDSVIATGGGVALSSENIKFLKMIGSLIYLCAPSHVLLKRLLNHGLLPAYMQQADPKSVFDRIVEERASIYEQACDFMIDTSTRSPGQLAEMICQLKTVHG